MCLGAILGHWMLIQLLWDRLAIWPQDQGIFLLPFPFAWFSYKIQEGVGALWTGIGPNIARNAIINAAELASYDQVKQVKALEICVLRTILVSCLPCRVTFCVDSYLIVFVADNFENSGFHR